MRLPTCSTRGVSTGGLSSRTTGNPFACSPWIELLPQLLAGYLRSVVHCPQLAPGHLGQDGMQIDDRGETTVRSGDNVLAANQAGVLDDPLGDQLWVLHDVGLD